MSTHYSTYFPTRSHGLHCPAYDDTAFDRLVASLGLQDRPAEWEHSPVLRRFAKKHANNRYVPESLLLKWGLEQEPNIWS